MSAIVNIGGGGGAVKEWWFCFGGAREKLWCKPVMSTMFFWNGLLSYIIFKIIYFPVTVDGCNYLLISTARLPYVPRPWRSA
jgi:hypothetical protein